MKHADEWIDFRIKLPFMNFVQSKFVGQSQTYNWRCNALVYHRLGDISLTTVLSVTITSTTPASHVGGPGLIPGQSM
jgi:hypothetical protein